MRWLLLEEFGGSKNERAINYRMTASGKLEYRDKNFHSELVKLFEEMKFDSINAITESTVYGGNVYLGTIMVRNEGYIHFSFSEPSLQWQKKVRRFK